MLPFKRQRHLDPRREWIRRLLPTGSAGFTFEDLDGIVSIFPTHTATRARRLMLVEHKWNIITLDRSQQIVFRQLHQALRQSHPNYLGFYLVTWPGVPRSREDDEFEIDFHRQPRINGIAIGWPDLVPFYLGELNVPSLFDANETASWQPSAADPRGRAGLTRNRP